MPGHRQLQLQCVLLQRSQPKLHGFSLGDQTRDTFSGNNPATTTCKASRVFRKQNLIRSRIFDQYVARKPARLFASGLIARFASLPLRRGPSVLSTICPP